RADLRARDGRAVALGRDHTELPAVRGVDERVLADGDRTERLEIAARAEDCGRTDGAGHDHDERHPDEERQRERLARALLPVPGAALAAAALLAHPQTPRARRRPCARTRNSRSSS